MRFRFSPYLRFERKHSLTQSQSLPYGSSPL